jgi:hypothetical protein
MHDALESAHCATLRIDAHPRGRIALASRVCLRPRPFENVVVEERGIVDLDRRRFTFVRAPFAQADAGDRRSWSPSCSALDNEPASNGALDAVSHVRRNPLIAPCMLARASSSEHVLWTWRGELVDPNLNAPDGHPLVSWSKSGRFIALHRLTSNQHEQQLVVESVLVDTRSLASHNGGAEGVYVPRFRGEIAEVITRRDEGVESSLVDYRASPHKTQRGLALSYNDRDGLWADCDDDKPGTKALYVDVTTFPGFFDKAACRRYAREHPEP